MAWKRRVITPLSFTTHAVKECIEKIEYRPVFVNRGSELALLASWGVSSGTIAGIATESPPKSKIRGFLQPFPRLWTPLIIANAVDKNNLEFPVLPRRRG
jgi:tetrahydromethanopterin S-methyltransferase subunit F